MGSILMIGFGTSEWLPAMRTRSHTLNNTSFHDSLGLNTPIKLQMNFKQFVLCNFMSLEGVV